MTLSGCILQIGKKKPRAGGARHRANGAPGWGARKSAPIKMNTTRGELFLALKQNNRLKSGLRLTPGRPYSREGANQRPRRAARRSMSFATMSQFSAGRPKVSGAVLEAGKAPDRV